MALLAELEMRCNCSLVLVTKWLVDIPIYVVFTSCKHVNLRTIMDFKATGALDFKLKMI